MPTQLLAAFASVQSWVIASDVVNTGFKNHGQWDAFALRQIARDLVCVDRDGLPRLVAI